MHRAHAFFGIIIFLSFQVVLYRRWTYPNREMIGIQRHEKSLGQNASPSKGNLVIIDGLKPVT